MAATITPENESTDMRTRYADTHHNCFGEIIGDRFIVGWLQSADKEIELGFEGWAHDDGIKDTGWTYEYRATKIQGKYNEYPLLTIHLSFNYLAFA